VHYLATMINTASTLEINGEFAGGFVVTLYIAAFTMIFSLPLGIMLALGRTSTMPLFRILSTTYIEIVRGIPFITILFFFAVFVNFFLPEGMELAKLAAAGIGFSLFGAAYLAENVRGGLQAVRRGQYEASDALGLTTVQRTGFIVLPQALRVSIPPLVGGAIGTFKETSLLSIVGIIDFTRVANSSIPGQTEFVGIKREGLLFISLIYWIGAYSMSKYSQRLEKQLGVGER
jgi:general L-amino acid transport system permease protein